MLGFLPGLRAPCREPPAGIHFGPSVGGSLRLVHQVRPVCTKGAALPLSVRKYMLFLAKICRMIYCGFHFLSTFYSILLGHLANNFNFLLRSEFQKVMYCCTVNESTNNLQGNEICKSLPNIAVTQPGRRLPYSSAILPERAWRFLEDSWAWLGLPGSLCGERSR